MINGNIDEICEFSTSTEQFLDEYGGTSDHSELMCLYMLYVIPKSDFRYFGMFEVILH
jgi:hypothetical protein